MNSEDYKKAGNNDLAAGKFDSAVENYTKAIEIDPNNHVLYSNRSAVFIKLMQYNKALEDAEKCIQVNPNWAKGYSRKGNALEFMDKFDEAKEAYEKGLKLDPSNKQMTDALENLKIKQDSDAGGFPGGNLFSDPLLIQKLEKDPKVSQHLKDPAFRAKIEMMRLNPSGFANNLNDPRMMDVLGALLGIDASKIGVHSGDGDMTMPKEDEPMETSNPKPTTTEKPNANSKDNLSSEQKKALAEKDLGNEAYKSKDFETALKHYDNAIAIDGTNAAFYNNKAAVYFEQKDYEQVKKYCLQAVEIGRDNRADYTLIAKAYSRMASAYQKQDDLENAKKFYEKSLSEHRAPDIVKKLNALNKMIKEKERLANLDPEEAEKQKVKGNELFQAGKFPDALTHYNEAIKRNPDDAKIYSNRAACYMKLMEFGLALKDCDKCIELDSKFIKGYIRKGACLMAMKDASKAGDAYKKALLIDRDNKEAMEGYRLAVSQDTSDPKEASKRALNDPEVQEILGDPAMQMILGQMQKDPGAVREHLQNPHIASKLQKLMEAGVVQLR